MYIIIYMYIYIYAIGCVSYITRALLQVQFMYYRLIPSIFQFEHSSFFGWILGCAIRIRNAIQMFRLCILAIILLKNWVSACEVAFEVVDGSRCF